MSALWRTALHDAAGVIAAYITPRDYSLASFEVQGVARGAVELELEVAARVDLAAARDVHRLLPRFDTEATQTFRHQVVNSVGYLRGKLHMPRYLRALARGDTSTFPVRLATKQSTTPENNFLSELLRLSANICTAWITRGGAEADLARHMVRDFSITETRTPWSALRSHPKPSLRELSSIVRGRVISGAVPKGSAAEELSKRFPPHRTPPAIALEETEDALLFLLTNDQRFEDRIFELICLSWILDAFRRRASNFRLDLGLIKGAGGLPLADCTVGRWTIDIFFQSGAVALPTGRWTYEHNGAALRAIPDILIKCRDITGTERLLLIDAKNRTIASESEVAYKLLGYKENLNYSPYVAAGIYPNLGDTPRVRGLAEGLNRVVLVHAPLARGKALAQLMVANFIAGLA